MGSFRSSHSMIPESDRASSVPHFMWFHPSFLSSTSHGFNPFQATQINPEPGISADPLRSSSPIDDTVKDVDVGSTLPKSSKKQKTSKRSSKDISPNELKQKQSKNAPTKSSKTRATSVSKVRKEKKNLNFSLDDKSVDLSGIPAPVCTCTGVARQCYRWGSGGWQSSCCTINISEYPLPMSSSRPGSRMAGRKMSHGAYEKLIQRLVAEGYDFTHPVDLKEHWARHGTNKFVIIK